MAKVLILSTGGSSEPLVKSINQNRPDFVIFVCSADKQGPPREAGSHVMVDGSGKPCKMHGGAEKGGEDRDSIVIQTGLGAYEKILITNPDHLAECYRASLEAIQLAHTRFSEAQISVDYTGGTKTMSSALAMAAIDYGDVELYVVSGPRHDLIKVASGTEMLRHVDWIPILWMRKQKILEELFRNYDYAACIELIDDLASRISAGSDLDAKLSAYLAICRGFQAWDEFRHEEALNYLKPYGSVLPVELTFLNSIVRGRNGYEKQAEAAQRKTEGFCEGVKANLGLVQDILRNAERRLFRRQYDDAIGRIYRALELLAQTALLYMYPPIYTSDVRINLLPKALREKYQDLYEQQAANGSKRLQLPLFKSYELLHDLGYPLGHLAWERQKEMLDLIRLRNNAISAHGLDPVSKDNAWNFYSFVCSLLEDTEREMKIGAVYMKQPQFPVTLPVI